MLLVPPHITPFSFEAEAFAGDGVQLSCYVARGDLPLNVSWSLEGRAVEHIKGVAVERMGTRNSLLTIESVAAEHSGNYTCTATNRAASVQHTAPLLVNGTPLTLSLPPLAALVW